MRLWIDAQCFQTSSRMRGIGRYVIEFIAQLHRDHPEIEIIASLNAGLFDGMLTARKILAPFILPQNIFVWEGTAREGEGVSGHTDARILSQHLLTHHVATLAPDIALCASPMEGGTDPTVPLEGGGLFNIPTVGIFYDAIPLRYASIYLPNDEMRNYYERRIGVYKTFDHILTISEFSKVEALDLFPDVSVTNIDAAVSHDMESLIQEKRQQTSGHAVSQDVLYVGGIDWRKNVALIVDAFQHLPRLLRHSTRFVLIGDHPESQSQEVTDKWLAYGLPRENLIHMGHTSDEELIETYLKSACLVQPSRMEGFGLTALEAMMCGIPVLGADAGALPEVINNPDVMFDPDDATALSRLLTRIMIDEQFAADCVTNGLAKAKRYSWSRSVDLALNGIRALDTSSPKLTDVSKLRQMSVKNYRRPRDIPIADLAKRFAATEPPRCEPPRFLIDITSTAQVDPGTGIQRVVRQITEQLMDRDDLELTATPMACTSFDGFRAAHLARRADMPKVKQPKLDRIPITTSAQDIILMLDSSWPLWKTHGHILKAAQARGTPIYSVVYDLIPLMLPGMANVGVDRVFASWLRAALTYSDGFMCISKAVADEFMDFLNDIDFPHPTKVGWWPLGADIDDAPEPNFSGDDNHFLMVGTVEPRKGHPVVLDAFEALWADGEDIKLTILGRHGWSMTAFEDRISNHPELGRRLFRLDNATDDDLKRAYETHRYLISASYAEGFGLPLIEGHRKGCQLLVSDIPVFHEVAPAGTVFFDPYNAQDIADVIRSVKQDQKPFVASETVDWATSADALYKLCVSGDFQKTYMPNRKQPFLDRSKIGGWSMEAPVDIQSPSQVTLPYGNTPEDVQGKWLYRVRVKNLTDATMFGDRDEDDALYGFNISYRAFDKSGEEVFLNCQRTTIPYALGPRRSIVAGVYVDPSIIKSGVTHVEFGIVQEGYGWWRDVARVALPSGH